MNFFLKYIIITVFIILYILVNCEDSFHNNETGICIYSSNYENQDELSVTIEFPSYCEEEMLFDECICGSLFGGDETCKIEYKPNKKCTDEGFIDSCEDDKDIKVVNKNRDC